MKKPKLTDQQIAFALKQAESGTAVEEVYRKLGISQQNFHAVSLSVLSRSWAASTTNKKAITSGRSPIPSVSQVRFGQGIALVRLVLSV